MRTNACTIIVFGTKLSLEKVERNGAESADHCPTPEAVQGTDGARSGGASVGVPEGPAPLIQASGPFTADFPAETLCV